MSFLFELLSLYYLYYSLDIQEGCPKGAMLRGPHHINPNLHAFILQQVDPRALVSPGWAKPLRRFAK